MIKRFEIGSVLGIPIEVDLSLLLVVPFIAWAVATDVTAIVTLLGSLPGQQVSQAAVTAGVWPWVLGVVAAVCLFCSVLLHELGHSVVALRRGFDIEAITLWMLGGVAQFADEPEEWTDELAIAVIGPVVSVCLGVLGLALLSILPVSAPRLLFLAGYLGTINLLLAGFNLLPGFPMDGGRILRALLARTRPMPEATDLAATVGKVVAVGFGILAIVSFDLLLLAIAFFVYLGASAEATQTRLRSSFEETTVGDLMTPATAVETVEPQTSVATLLNRMYHESHTGYPVVEDEQLRGIVTLDDVRGLADRDHETTTVGSVMSTELRTVSPDSPAYDALEQLQDAGIGRLVVTDATGSMAGLVSRTDLLTAATVSETAPRAYRHRTMTAGRPGD